jgi:hypothetical protein
MSDVCSLAHVEACNPLRLFFEDIDMLHVGTARSLVHELDETLDRVLLSLEDGLDTPIPPVRDPSRDRALLGHSPHGIAKEHTLHATVRNDPPADHEAYSPAHCGLSRDPEAAANGSRLHIRTSSP